MRVVIIADFAQPSGGAQAVAIGSAVALAERGIRVTYVHGVAGEPDGALASAGVQTVSLGLADIWHRPALSASVSGIWDREAARRLGAVLAGLEREPTVLHLHQWTRSLSPSAFGTLLGAGRPLAVTLHDYFLACPNGVYYRFEADEPCSLRPLSPSCLAAPCDPRSAAHKLIRVLRTAATWAATRRRPFDVIHVSDRGRAVITPLLPSALRHHRLDNPVDARPAAPAMIDGTARIAFIGRLTREKGADLVASAGRAAGMPTLFVGEGPAEAEIRRLDPQAEMLGWRTPEEVARLLRTRVRAVAAPSRWYETGPLTVYEALAAGLPAIASSRSGAAEKVVHGETGLVVEPDVASLAAAFASLADADVARRMGAAAHARYWAAPLDAAAHADGLLDIYRGMLARAP